MIMLGPQDGVQKCLKNGGNESYGENGRCNDGVIMDVMGSVN